jgi:hypothetical protein
VTRRCVKGASVPSLSRRSERPRFTRSREPPSPFRPISLPLQLSQHSPDDHRPERPILLAVDQKLAEGPRLRVAPEGADPIGASKRQDMEGFCAGDSPPSEGVLGSHMCLINLLKKHAPTVKCAGLLTATVAGMVAIVGDADSMKPFQRVRIGVTETIDAHPDEEVVSIREDVAGPADHAVVRRVMPGAALPLASRRRMDRDRSVGHSELIG